MNLKAESLLRGRMFKKLVECRCRPVCEKYGLKQIEAEVLFYMSKVPGPTTSSNICRNLMANKGQISQTMDALCRKGYLVSSADETDRRYIRFHLTDQAQEAVGEIRGVHEKLRDDLFSGIPEEELARFCETTRKILANAIAMMDAEL